MKNTQEIAQAMMAVGEKKAGLSVGKMLTLGVLAGAYIGLAGAAAQVLSCTVESASLARLISALIFPAGLAMIVTAGGELFTGNCLMTLALSKKRITWGAMLRNWVLVYLANFVGAAAVAALCAGGGLFGGFGGAWGKTAASAAASKCGLDFLTGLLRGFACNFLVCTAVWMAAAADTLPGKVMAVWAPIALFVAAGFEHSVANMYYLPAGLFLGAEGVTLGGCLMNLLPVTLGNILGGTALAMLFRPHAQ